MSAGRYNNLSVFFHWLSALVIIGMFGLGIWMVDLSYYDSWYHDAPELHKSTGILLSLLWIARIIWRLKSTQPEATGNAWEVKAAKAVHHFFYLWLILIFVSGYMISTADEAGISVFGWFEIPALFPAFDNQEDVMGEIHEWLTWSLMFVVALHAAGALKHQFIDKDNIFSKMWFHR